VPPALEEHSQDKVSLLRSPGFWKFLATNTTPAQAVGFGGVSRELQEAQMKNRSRKKQPPGERQVLMRITEVATLKRLRA